MYNIAMYSLIKKLLFQLDPELSHKIALNMLKYGDYLRINRWLFPHQHATPVSSMGLTFPHRIGLAAGMDKDGDYIDALASLGFGFIEIGTVTPQPQEGNPKPRLFRLVKEEAIINRMGFNNKGADYVVSRLEKMRYRGILGINIGKNRDTPIEHALDDYIIGFKKFWRYASYITVNISSPNTAQLRELQQPDSLEKLLSALKQEQQSVLQTEHKYVPLVVKISPDLTTTEVQQIANVLLALKIDGVIATNTSVSRQGVENSLYAKEAGGLSGRPLNSLNTRVITELHKHLGDRIPIIAAGGIMDAASAQEKLTAGASLLQIYSGFIFSGPQLIWV